MQFTVTLDLDVSDPAGGSKTIPASKLARAVGAAIERELSTDLGFRNEVESQLSKLGEHAWVDVQGATAVPAKKKNLTP